MATAPRRSPARTWVLLGGAGLCLLASASVTVAIVLYRRAGVLFYPSLTVVNYSLHGVPWQALALLVGAVSLAALWLGLQWGSRVWEVAAALGFVASLAGLIVGANPYRPVSQVADRTKVYRLDAYQADAHTPELFLLFACDTTGTMCHWVTAFAPFDVVSGQHLSGTPVMKVDPTTNAVTLRLAGHIIGVYQPK